MAAPGLPASQILSAKYVDFGELPCRGSKLYDYLQSRRQVKDFATWSQCFALYSAVPLSGQGPIFIGHRGKTQQKIQVDHIRSTIPSRSRGLRKYEVGQGASMPNASRACEEAPCVPRWTIPCRLLPPNPGPSEYPPDYSRPAPRPCPGLNSPRRSRAELHGLSGTCLLKLS